MMEQIPRPRLMTRRSWEITGPDVVAELANWIQFGEAERQLLAGLRESAEAVSRAFAEDFVARVASSPATMEYAAPYPVEALIATLANWFIELFSGVYDLDYARSRIRIGQVHVRLGLPVRYPIAMFDLVSRYGEQVAQAGGPAAVQAFRKVLSLDIAAFTQAYEEQQLGHLADLMGNERLARRLLMNELPHQDPDGGSSCAAATPGAKPTPLG